MEDFCFTKGASSITLGRSKETVPFCGSTMREIERIHDPPHRCRSAPSTLLRACRLVGGSREAMMRMMPTVAGVWRACGLQVASRRNTSSEKKQSKGWGAHGGKTLKKERKSEKCCRAGANPICAKTLHAQVSAHAWAVGGGASGKITPPPRQTGTAQLVAWDPSATPWKFDAS